MSTAWDKPGESKKSVISNSAALSRSRVTPAFRGMCAPVQARVTVVEFLKEKGLFRGTSDNPMRLGLCSRWGGVGGLWWLCVWQGGRAGG